MLGLPVTTSVSDFYGKPSLTFFIIAFSYASHGKFITPHCNAIVWNNFILWKSKTPHIHCILDNVALETALS